MITNGDVKTLLSEGVVYKRKCIAMIKDILHQHGANDENNAIQFDARNGQAPQFNSNNCIFDEGNEVYITEMWLDEEGDIRANYQSVEEGEEEYDNLIEDESEVDYEDILGWLANQL